MLPAAKQDAMVSQWASTTDESCTGDFSGNLILITLIYISAHLEQISTPV